jgi:hypothetical protein
VAAVGSVHPSGLPAHPDASAALARLRGFRAGLYACCMRRADALLDLADALLSAQGPVASLPQLSLEPAHRRGWGSLYAALAHGHIDAEQLRACWSAIPWRVGCRSMRWTSPPGRAATLSARQSAACTTTPPGTRPASRSSLAGRSSGSASSVSPGTRGPPRSTPGGCTRWTTPTTPPPARSARCLRACLLTGPSHGCVRRRLRLCPAHPRPR